MSATPPTSAAADRNKQPILELLQRLLPNRGTALEIAAGEGQHAIWFATAMPGWAWQPTDSDPHALAAIAARSAVACLTNLRAPLLLDVTGPQWPSLGSSFPEPFEAIYCANMLHIAPWNSCAGLMRGSARHLASDGLLITYGPYFEDGVPAAPSNEVFDSSLRQRDPRWGIRRLADVTLEARQAALRLQSRHEMPANNLLLVFSRAR